MERKSSALITRIIIIVALMVTIIAIYILFTLTNPRKTAVQQEHTIADEINIGGAFELTDQNDKIFNSTELKGKLSLIYFGFTYCPDICPESLNKLSEILNTLDKYKININALFITVDPLRDTSTVLKEYLHNFHPNIKGLTGSEQQIKEVAQKFKVFYARADNGADQNNYMLDHTSFIYLMDKNSKYMKHFYMTNSTEEIIEYIRVNK